MIGGAWIRSGGVIVALFALLPAAAIAGAMALPVLLSLAGAASFRPSLLRKASENRPLPLVALVTFLAWAIISGIWSPYTDHTQAAKVAALVSLGLAVSASAARPPALPLVLPAVVAACAVLSGLLAIEALFDLPLSRAVHRPDLERAALMLNPSKGAVVLLALVWAGAAGLIAWRRRAAAAVLLAVATFLALQFDQSARAIGHLMGLTAFAAGWAAPALTVRATSYALAAWMLAAPFLTPLMLANHSFNAAMPESWAQRAGIWTFACAQIGEAPWFGRGFNASRAITEHITVRGVDMPAVPLHPHSASLQIWLETGAAGATLAAFAIVFAGEALARRAGDNPPATAAVAAAMASLGFMANASYSVWQEWWIATLFLAAIAICGLAARR